VQKNNNQEGNDPDVVIHNRPHNLDNQADEMNENNPKTPKPPSSKLHAKGDGIANGNERGEKQDRNATSYV